MATKTKKSVSRVVDNKEQAVLAAVKNLSSQSLFQETAEAQQKIQESFADVSQSIAAAFQQLSNIESAIGIKQGELQQLHKLEPKLLEIEALEQKHAELLATQDTLRQAWAREEAEYIYNRDRTRRLEEDEYQTEKDRRLRDLDEEEEERRKVWQSREVELLEQETELLDLRKQVASFAEQIQKAVQEAIADTTTKLKLQHDTRMTIMEKDYQTEKRVHEQHLSSMQAQILTLKDQNAALKAALEKSQTDMKDLMTKYFELNSGREALQILERNRTSEPSVPPRK